MTHCHFRKKLRHIRTVCGHMAQDSQNKNTTKTLKNRGFAFVCFANQHIGSKFGVVEKLIAGTLHSRSNAKVRLRHYGLRQFIRAFRT